MMICADYSMLVDEQLLAVTKGQQVSRSSFTKRSKTSTTWGALLLPLRLLLLSSSGVYGVGSIVTPAATRPTSGGFLMQLR
jgi:hypothetical protein